MATIERQLLDYYKRKGFVEINQYKKFEINKKKYTKSVIKNKLDRNILC